MVSNKFLKLEKALLTECLRVGATGINNLNVARANFATTYSTHFCELIADLLLLYKNHSLIDPIGRVSEQFLNLKIQSCRGSEMNRERVEYLVSTKISKLPRTSSFRLLKTLTKFECPVCSKWKSNLQEHMKSHLGDQLKP